jgi:hypothetical protein
MSPRLQVEELSQLSVGIQKHFMVAEIPGFDLPNRLSGLTMYVCNFSPKMVLVN